MKEMQFSVEIHASRERIWDTLWRDETFRDWAGIIDPGTYMVGELKEGNEVQFISSENGYGVTSLVEKLTPGECLPLSHRADTQDVRKRERVREWTGGTESYSLEARDGSTTLTFACDVPTEMDGCFQVSYPKALGRVKALAERSRRL